MKIPIFPLNGAIIFPNTNLPLNIFEQRYIDMVDYSLSNNKVIGMIQHKGTMNYMMLVAMEKLQPLMKPQTKGTLLI